MIKFNDNNIYVGQIKQILHEFNLPQCEVYNPNKHYLNNQLVINKGTISKVTETGLIPIMNYKFGDYIPNLTKNLEINSMLYDSYTHKYLGEFLRFIKDYKGINLMSMYNCFTYESPKRLKFELNDTIKFDTDEKGYNIFMLPVKFGQEYTIGIDYHGEISMCCGFYDNTNLLIEHDSSGFMKQSFFKKAGLRFNHPFIYKVPNNISSFKLSLQEKNLKLFIKVPSTCTSSIVVLEGNYLKNCELILGENKQTLGNKLFEYKYNDICYGNFDYMTKLQLLSFNSKIKYLLADRLLEYLSNNVITPLDEIDINIKNLQSKMYDYKLIPYINTYGIFDNDMRKALYRFSIDKNIINKKFDLLGYCDKDIELKLGSIYSTKKWKTIKDTGGIN